jgi:Insertion element 4 transposase N-terminal
VISHNHPSQHWISVDCRVCQACGVQRSQDGSFAPPSGPGDIAPGHVGELTALVPFELVDAVLHKTRSVQRRLRDLPSRVGVSFLPAMRLFSEVGYQLVWQKLTALLTALPVATPP